MKAAAGGVCAVICHDAGGAEILSSYVRRTGLRCVFALDGPARKVFERKLGPIQLLAPEEAVNESDWVLVGTSWQSELEFEALGSARVQGKHAVAFLDHWVNYRERFERSGEIHLPDEIWVGDAHALRIAEEAFPAVPIRLIENPYFLDLRDEITQRQRKVQGESESLRVLYVCEPIKEHAKRRYGDERHWGYTEEDALRYFLGRIDTLGKPFDEIVIRPHPSEEPDKYVWAEREYNLPIKLGGTRPLIDEIVDSNVVVGCNSMAMVVGLLAGKRVISCVPPSGQPCSLPQTEIMVLRDSPEPRVTSNLGRS